MGLVLMVEWRQWPGALRPPTESAGTVAEEGVNGYFVKLLQGVLSEFRLCLEKAGSCFLTIE